MSARRRARRSSPFYIPSAFGLFTPSKDLFLKHIDVFGLLYIIPALLWLHSWISTPTHGLNLWSRSSDANYSWTFPGSFNAALIGFSILWFIFAIIVGLMVQIMLQKSQLDVVSTKKPDIGRAWQTAKKMWRPMIGLYIVMVLIFLAGLILLLIPGLFMIRRYIFAPYVMLEKKCGIKQALEESHQLGLTNTGAVWGLIGVMFLISLVGVLPLIGSLASFVVGALYSIAPALRYEQLKKLV